MHTTSRREPTGVQPQAESGRVEIRPDGIHWKDGIYLVPTSDVDGKQRWETIILLLFPKVRDDGIGQFLAKLKASKQKANEP